MVRPTLLRDRSSPSIYVWPCLLIFCYMHVLTQAVYIYRVVLDSVNGVSSTRSTSIAAFDLQEGEIRQLQFVEDDTLMILWSHPSMFPFFIIACPSNPDHTTQQTDPSTSSTSPSNPRPQRVPAPKPNPPPTLPWNTKTAMHRPQLCH